MRKTRWQDRLSSSFARKSFVCVYMRAVQNAGTHLAAASAPNVRHRCHIRLRAKPNSLRAIVRFGAHPFVEIRKRCTALTLHLGGNLCLVPATKQQQQPEVSEQRSASRGEWPERRQASQVGRQCVPARQCQLSIVVGRSCAEQQQSAVCVLDLLPRAELFAVEGYRRDRTAGCALASLRLCNLQYKHTHTHGIACMATIEHKLNS
jgi:hypothetical protein